MPALMLYAPLSSISTGVDAPLVCVMLTSSHDGKLDELQE
jgi:hypothetical protein